MAKKAKDDTSVNDTSVLDGAPATMKPEIVTFLVKGLSPLLQNNPAEFIGVDDVESLAAKKEYNDEDEARRRCYMNPDGLYCHPAGSFTKAMMKAVSGKKFGKMFATSAIKGAVFIAEPFSVIEDADGEPHTTYSIDRRSVVIGKSRILRCRPCWHPWQMRVPLEIDTAILTPSQVLESLALAGRIIGIGDYRPEKSGGFGRFTAELLA